VVGRAWSLMFWRPVVTAGMIAEPETPQPREAVAPAPKAAALSAAPTPPDAEPTPGHNPPALLLPVVVTAAAAIALGVWPAPLLDLSDMAAGNLLDPSAYIRAVFGSVP